MKKIVINLLKLGFSAGLLAYLAYGALRDPQFQTLVAGPKDWAALIAAWLLVLTAVSLNVLRWFLLVRALRLECSPLDALRAGYIGYACTLLPFGLAAGDAVKAGLLIARNRNRKTESVATVVIDRVVGLYALLVLAAVASLAVDVSQLPFQEESHRTSVAGLVQTVRWAAGLGTAGLVVMLLPGFTTWALWDALAHLPLVGGMLTKLVSAMRQYRRAPGVLAVVIGMSLVVHTLFAVMVYWAALGLRSPGPPLASHLIFVPVSMCAGALPWGGLEAVLSLLYPCFSPAVTPPSQGLIIALVYRLFQMATAGVGVAFYLLGGSEVARLARAAEETPETQAAAAKTAGN